MTASYKFFAAVSLAAVFLNPAHSAAQDTAGLGVVTGLVVDADDQPALAVTVCVVGTTRCTITGEDGRFRLGEIRPGLQVLEITEAVVVALNLMDEAERRGLRIDHRSLARDLGVPVVPMAAKNRKGLLELAATVADVVTGQVALKPHRVQDLDPEVELIVATLAKELQKRYPGIDNARWVALRLLEGDPGVENEVRQETLGSPAHAGPKLAGDTS